MRRAQDQADHTRRWIGLILAIATLVLLPNIVSALMNPSAVYCARLGYIYRTETTKEGERGVCSLPNGQQVDAWQFLRGEAAQEFTYCRKAGLQIKTVADSQACSGVWSERCAVCRFQNGTEVEVTRLMDLRFDETTCGDGACSDPENSVSCPADCPKGGADGLCDAVADRVCDPDCGKGQDPDCPEEVPLDSIPAVTAVAALVILSRRIR